MRKTAVLALALIVAVAASGCWGPEKLTRHLDDWTNQAYVENPWLTGNIVSTGILHVLFLATGIMDGFINGYFFWFIDAEPLGDGVGTKFQHRPVTPAKP